MKTAFDKFYARPTPLGAVELALADAMHGRMPGEFVASLMDARDLLVRVAAQHNEFSHATDAEAGRCSVCVKQGYK